ncbi:MAG: hypothetical protein L0221_16880 [Chloroflexi bacterium]|nr:hypothetical protein [Chloroflexota bacterium]
MFGPRTFVAVVLLAAFAAGGLAFPKAAYACSCAGEPRLGDAVESDLAVLVGRVGAERADGAFDVAVERWFRGGAAAVVPVMSSKIVFADGTSMIDTCGINLETGQHLILVAGRSEDGYRPSSCSVRADADSEEGRQLIVEATRLFGPGFVPETAPPETDPGLDLAFVLPALGGLLFVAIVLFAFVRRERPHPGGPSA